MPPAAISTSRPDLFEDVGKKVEDLSLDQHGVTDSANLEEADLGAGADGDSQRMVDEIESLCMNCQEDVGTARPFSNANTKHRLLGYHAIAPHAHTILQRDYPYVVLLSTLSL
jgi:hypothetical protein